MVYRLLFVSIFLVNSVFGQSELFINVKEHGVIGDGKTNDYFALMKIVDKVNRNGGGEVFFPKGVYYLDVHYSPANKYPDLEFKGCNQLKIHGEDAIISVKGDFHRPVTRKSGRHSFSNVYAITPLKITNCNNVTVANLEIRGNVDKTTKDPGVIETGGRLLFISNSKNIHLHDLFLHHAQMDGIYILGAENLTAENLTSSNNARQGMSIIKMTNGTFINCKFMNSGFTSGDYGAHAPRAGVDIEPNNKEQKVNNVKFVNCRFENNLGSQFVASHPWTTDNITLENCTFIANEKSHKYTIIVNAKNVVFKNSAFDCKNGQIYPVWQKEGSSSVFDGCDIKSNTNAFIAVSQLKTNTVKINNCSLEYTGNKVLGSYFPYIRMKNMTFTNNKITIPSQFYRPKGPSALIQSAQMVSGNKFYSEGKIAKPNVSYTGANVVK